MMMEQLFPLDCTSPVRVSGEGRRHRAVHASNEDPSLSEPGLIWHLLVQHISKCEISEGNICQHR